MPPNRLVALGAGNFGSGLARCHAARGHDVCLAFSRNRGKLKAVARAVGARPAEPQEAVAAAEAVVLATPWTVTEAAPAERPRSFRQTLCGTVPIH